MKLIFIISLILFSNFCNAQRLYYGGSAGIGLVEGYHADTKEMKFGANDLYISVPLGYAFVKDNKSTGLLLETQEQGTLSGTFTLSALAGLKIDISEHSGIHLLAGYADDILYTKAPFQL